MEVLQYHWTFFGCPSTHKVSLLVNIVWKLLIVCTSQNNYHSYGNTLNLYLSVLQRKKSLQQQKALKTKRCASIDLLLPMSIDSH